MMEINRETFPEIKLVGKKVQCPYCKKQVCCQDKQCTCGISKSELNAIYQYQRTAIMTKKRKAEMEANLNGSNSDSLTVDGKVLVWQGSRCPNPDCQYLAYYCKNGCNTNPEFDMTKFLIHNKRR